MKKTRRFVSSLCDVRQKTVIGRLGCIELEASVQIKLPEGLLDRLERVESRLKGTTVDNEPTIDAVKNIRVEVNKLLELESSPPNRPIKKPDNNTTDTQPTPMRLSPEKTLPE